MGRATTIARGQAVTDGITYQACNIVNAESLHQFRPKRLDGLDMSVKLAGNLPRAQAFRDQLKNFSLPRRQLGEWIALSGELRAAVAPVVKRRSDLRTDIA